MQQRLTQLAEVAAAKWLRVAGMVALLVGGGMLLDAAPVRIQLPPETAQFKPGPGAELATAQCLVCHSADYISTQPRLSRGQWKAGVQKMQQKYGAPIPDSQIETLVDYLVKNYGTDMTNRTVKPSPVAK